MKPILTLSGRCLISSRWSKRGAAILFFAIPFLLASGLATFAQDPDPEDELPTEPFFDFTGQVGTDGSDTDFADYFPAGAATPNGSQLQFEVDQFTGRFTYRLPIEIPPVRGGFQPQLVLRYDSRDGNGYCGVGWSLPLDSITRDTSKGVPVKWVGANPSQAYDELKGFVASFGGSSMRLILAGSPTANPLEFHPEIDRGQYLRFLYWNSVAGNPYWEVIDKGGNHYKFGLSASTRLENPNWPGSVGSSVFSWAIDMAHDANNNTIQYFYDKFDNKLYPNHIDYGASLSIPNLPATCRVEFELSADGVRPDNPLTLRSSFRSQTRRRLLNIRVKTLPGAGANLVRRYNLAYTQSSYTAKSLLSSITIFGTNDSSTLPTIQFGYQSMTWRFADPVPWDSTISGMRVRDFVDVDGDALPDLLRNADPSAPYTAPYRVAYNTGSGFITNSMGPVLSQAPNSSYWTRPRYIYISSSTAPSSTIQYVGMYDINGDGFPDRVETEKPIARDQFFVQFNTGKRSPLAPFQSIGFGPQMSDWLTVLSPVGGTRNYSIAAWYLPYPNIQDGYIDSGFGVTALVDINGDGLPDRVLSATRRDDVWAVQLNTGSGFGPLLNWYSVEDFGISATDIGLTERIAFKLVDINGDGLPDKIIYSHSNPPGQPAIGLFSIEFNHGGGFEILNPPAAPDEFWYRNREHWPVPSPPVWFAAHSYSGTSQSTKTPDQMTADINGDGLPDHLYLEAGQSVRTLKVLINNGGGFTEAAQSFQNVQRAAANDVVTIGVGGSPQIGLFDINGDGLADRIMRDAVVPGKFQVQLNEGPMPDLMNSINNGKGGTVAIAYKPSTQYNNQDDDPKCRLPYVLYTTSWVRLSDGLGNTTTNSYDYSGGLFDTARREFVGFHYCAATNAARMVTRTFFHQGGGRSGSAYGEFEDAYAKRGMPFRIETLGNDNNLYRLTLNKVDLIQRALGGSFAFVSQTIKKDVELGTLSRATASRYLYDSTTGNLTRSEFLGEVQNVNESTHSFSPKTPEVEVYTHISYGSYALYGAFGNTVLNRPTSIRVTPDVAGNILRRAAEFTYDSVGNVKTHNVWYDTAYSFFTVETDSYDQYGNVNDVVDGRGIHTVISYDSSKTYPTVLTFPDWNNNIIKFVYDARFGQPVLSVDANGLVTSNCVDAFLRPVETSISTTANGQAGLWQTRIDYSLGVDNNAFPHWVRTRVNDSVDANGWESYAYQDGLGRTIQGRLESERANKFRTQDTVYDFAGRVKFQTRPYFGDELAYVPLAGEHTCISNYFDPLSRISRVTHNQSITFGSGVVTLGSSSGDVNSPSGYTTTSYKDGADPWATVVSSGVDAHLRVRKHFHDAYGSIYQITEVNQGNAYRTQFAYDIVGNLLKITNHHGNITTLEYDSIGNQKRIVDPDVGEWTYRFDPFGRLISQHDPRNNTIDFDWDDDPLGRLSAKKVYANGSLVRTSFYGYDYTEDNDFTVLHNQLSYIYTDNCFEEFSYDFRGRTLKRRMTVGNTSYLFQYAYDDAERLKEITYPNDWGHPRYTYDNGGNTKLVENIAGGPTLPGTPTLLYRGESFDEEGRVQTITWGNSLQTSHSFYTKTRRLQRIQTTAVSPPGSYHQDTDYRYDEVANPIRIYDNVVSHTGGASGTFDNVLYDDLNRLLSYTRGGFTTNFGYQAIRMLSNDENGLVDNYGYDWAGPHAVTWANGPSYSYDAAGNMFNRNGHSIVYDQENRLVQYDSYHYGYSDSGDRIYRQNQYGYIDNLWLDELFEQNGSSILLHIYADGRRISSFSPMGSQYYFYHPDHLGSTTFLTDGTSGSLAAHYEYNAFGKPRFSSGGPITTSRFTGHLYESETGLYWCGSRYYDPELGRFIQPDSIRPSFDNPQELDPYGYGLNGPLRFVDPDGHQSLSSSYSYGIGYGSDSLDPVGYSDGWDGGSISFSSDQYSSGDRTVAQISNTLGPVTDGILNVPIAAVGFLEGAFGLSFDLAGDTYNANHYYGNMQSVFNAMYPFARAGWYQRGSSTAVASENSLTIVTVLLPTSRIKHVAVNAAPSPLSTSGGLNLYKRNYPTSTAGTGWKAGDRFLFLPNQGFAKGNWKQNAGRLRAEMRRGERIFDSYRDAVSGQIIPTKGFLNAERALLQNNGWKYNPTTGAWHPLGAFY